MFQGEPHFARVTGQLPDKRNAESYRDHRETPTPSPPDKAGRFGQNNFFTSSREPYSPTPIISNPCALYFW